MTQMVGLSALSASLQMTPSQVVDRLKGRDAIQRDLDRIEEQNHVTLMKFNKVKCRPCTWVKAITRISTGW